MIEVFRRMNSYTVPLNPEEKRHAGYQGEFKWFINRLSKTNQPTFRTVGAFSEKQFFRMADAKLLTEICHAIDKGIATTNARMLDNMYKDFDKKFADEDTIEKVITIALGELSAGLSYTTAPDRPHQLYSLNLSAAHVRLVFRSCHRCFVSIAP